jgi:N-acyl-D-amino-acid deacylase
MSAKRKRFMAYDLLIKNGTVVDGTGAARVRADVAIAGDCIAEIGKISEGANRVIDASDLIVSPGFIDPHTHYDAQICWDPLISCTSWHGITSVVMGNCGVGVAPCKPESREIAAWDLTNVEAIPYESLNKGITWDWETFPQFLDAAQRRGTAINLGFLAPLTPFRHYVMGKESMERAATAEETNKVAALLSEAMAAGAMGFSTTTLKQHIGFHGTPLACRLASKDELKAYANVLKQHRKGSIEVALTKKIATVSEDEYQLLDMLLSESERPVTWLAMASTPRHPERAQQTLERCEPLIKRGGIPQVLCKPFVAARPAQSVYVRRQRGVESHFQSAGGPSETDLYGSGIPPFIPRKPQTASPVHWPLASGRDPGSHQALIKAIRRQDGRGSGRNAWCRPSRHVS